MYLFKILFYDRITNNREVLYMYNEYKEFCFKLNLCSSRQEIEQLIEDIDDDELHFAMEDKYNQILEYNKDETLISIKKILDFAYFNYKKKNK